MKNKTKNEIAMQYKKNAYVIVSHFNRTRANILKQGGVIYL